MQVVRFQCSCCSADLKMRDDALVGRPVDCPECRKPIVVRLDSAGNVVVGRPNEPALPVKQSAKTPAAAPVGATAPAAAATVRAAKPIPPSKPWLARIGLERILSTVPAWAAGAVLVAAVACVALGFAFWPRSDQPDAATSQKVVGKATQAETRGSGNSAVQPTVSAHPSADARKDAFKSVDAESRLVRLGELLDQYRKQHGNFPTGTAGQEALRPSERLSWLAELAAASLFPDRPAPVWIERWNDPRNDRFVRQQIPEFLNPAVEHRVSPQNYPATHFVGVAGVGEDAADLPVDHPRAGVFGNSRTTRLEDIRDGASNTFMVMGVTNDLGSWAAGGPATIRPLTREPYVNGPDGFGTGPTDRMSVLKADGSVQEMSTTTDPRIFRRMAAMADGLPLDATVPGEPGDRSRRPPEPVGPLTSARAGGPGDGVGSQLKQESPGAHRSPLPSTVDVTSAEKIDSRAPVVASRPNREAPGRQKGTAKNPTVDVAAGLSQRIVRFEQIKPVPLQDVLNLVEELLAVPIRGDKREIADLDDLLQTPVTFELGNTTVRQVLKTVLAKVGLTFEVEPDAIHLRKLESAPIGGLH
jgi:hypothetical protein